MYIGHRDLLRFVHRVLRRAQVPFAVSAGFSPKPRTTFGPALPLGVLAEHEPLDVELRDVLWSDDHRAELAELCEGAVVVPTLVLRNSVIADSAAILASLAKAGGSGSGALSR